MWPGRRLPDDNAMKSDCIKNWPKNERKRAAASGNLQKALDA